MNSVNIIGRLTSDCDRIETKNDSVLVKFHIAVNTGYKDKEEVSFFECVMFGKYADVMSQYLTKGQQVAVSGQLRQDRWEKDGDKKSKVKIVVQNLLLIGSKKEKKKTDDDILDEPDTPF